MPTTTSTKGKRAFSVVVEDGYVKVKRGHETICAAIEYETGRLRDIDFTDDAHRKSNPTRQAAMKAYRNAGYL